MTKCLKLLQQFTSPKIKKLAQKVLKSRGMLTTGETRELGASVMAYVSPPKEGTAFAVFLRCHGILKDRTG